MKMKTQEREPKERFTLNKVAQTFRFNPENVELLEKFARRAGMSKTAYVELALRDRLEKDANSIL